jgi:hypothetical protein
MRSLVRAAPPLRPALLAAVVALLAVLAPAARDAAAAPKPFAGLVSEDAFAGTHTYRQGVLRRIATAGAGTLRQTLDWATVEPVRGRRDWSRYDAYIGAAADAGIEVLPVIFNPPAWASSRPRRHAKRGTYPPKRVGDFAAFAAAAARRYGRGGSFWAAHPHIHAKPIGSWQVWNEPNLPVYWQPQPRAAGYVALLKATSEAIRAVDPAAQIVTAGLPESKLGIPLDTYVRQMYAAGAAGAFDALAVNPYAPTAGEVLAFLQHARALVDGLGHTEAKLWATEIGWSDNGPGGRFRLGPQGQARAIASVFATLWEAREALQLQGVVYFNWRDAKPYPGGKDFWGLHTGLVQRGGASKPALAAFTDAVAGLQ